MFSEPMVQRERERERQAEREARGREKNTNKSLVLRKLLRAPINAYTITEPAPLNEINNT